MEPVVKENFEFPEKITSDSKVSVYNMQGMLIKDGEWGFGMNLTVDLTAFPDGLYTIKIQDENRFYAASVIKQK